jgi:sugar O-acyltransferase (sialic acid O-acetyltransferase NeuD family)
MQETQNIILIGGGGHCKVVIDVIETQNKYTILGVVDLPEKLGQSILNYKYIGTDPDIPKLAEQCPNFVITAGQIQSPALRMMLFNAVIEAGGRLPIIISPTAHVSRYAQIGISTVIMHQSIVNTDARIGDNSIINNKVLIEHDAQVGNHTHISTGAIINGAVKIGNRCFIGSRSVTVHGVSVADDVIIGAGAVVTKNIAEAGVYVGSPARRIK